MLNVWGRGFVFTSSSGVPCSTFDNRSIMGRSFLLGTVGLLWAVSCFRACAAAELFIGTAKTSITPDEPVALTGQVQARISRKVETPCMASVLAIEAREGEKTVDELILVSADLVMFRYDLQDQFREYLTKREVDFDVDKVVLTATHTHTAPAMLDDRYTLPDDCMKPSKYVEFLKQQLADAIDAAWESRRKGGVSWGFGHAVVAYNRRISYLDGSARMYGATDTDNFSHVEGFEDHGVHVLFAHDAQQPAIPIGVAIDVACPAQEVGSGKNLNADYWHYVRETLFEQFSAETAVLGLCGAGGDQSPRVLWRTAAEERMRRGRGLSRLQEIARRINRAVDDAWAVARDDVRFDVPFAHSVLNLDLTMRPVSEEDYEAAKREVARLREQKTRGLGLHWNQGIVTRYEMQQAGKNVHPTEVHVIRIGDIAMCTNPYELFTDFGVRIQARSPAVQTFVVQLAGQYGKGVIGGYVPTKRAVEGGSYGATIKSNRIGHVGGQEIVDATVAELERLWAEP
jgi:hypothetical protein